MADPDFALDAFCRITDEFATFVEGRGIVSESDTRAKVIDRVLTEVCGWPEASMSREEPVDSGRIDYSLAVQKRPYLAVEAKKEGVSFAFPVTSSKTLKLAGSLLTDKQVSSAVTQVRGYCDDAGIRYAIATNGYAWIVFRAIREDMPWRQGNARVFPSAAYIQANFTEFWNFLSYEAIQKGSLDEEFGTSARIPRKLLRVVDNLFNADLPLERNRLHAQLYPIIQSIFEDIAEQPTIEILQSCYVHTGSLRVVTRDLNAVITDSIPAFLARQGAEEIIQGADHAGGFGIAIGDALIRQGGELYLLLGGIGSGKTTFIKRYQRTVGKPVLDGGALWFHLDLLESPIDPAALELFAWREILRQFRIRYQNLNLETRRNIKKAFASDIQVLSQTAFRAYMMRAGEFDQAISPYLEKWQADTADYTPRILRVAKTDRNLPIVIFIDNVDQLAPAYQAQIFLLAQRITRTVGSVTILVLREESYYTANLQQTLTAYTSRKFHIASPRFLQLIASRIRFALEILGKSEGLIDYMMRNGIPIDRPAIADFLTIIETSIFERNRNIARFIEAICFGNMRSALDMFAMFMTSGATDVDKMLNIYRRTGAYFVAFHEFVKSIMLGERRYYRDQASAIMNLFDCGAERNASHFTCLRIIRALGLRRGEYTREGQGYVDIAELVSLSEDVFDNREDVLRSLDRLVNKQLIEANTKSTESISGASHIRVTSAGWYYANYLVKSFAYLDLVLQDTPLNGEEIEADLRQLVRQVDNLSDREDQKLARMQVRFTRVRRFLRYLETEEQTERARFGLGGKTGIWDEPLTPELVDQIEREIAWIERRLRENRERYEEDIEVNSESYETINTDANGEDEDNVATSMN